MVNLMSLIEIEQGQEAIVSEIHGGAGMIRRLDALGIFKGKAVTKTGSQWMRGPVVVRCGNTEVAIGYGMARKIMVKYQ